MMVLGDYIYEIPPIGGKSLIQVTTNRIVSMIMLPGTLFNGRVIHMDLLYSLMTLMCASVYGTCSDSVVVSRVDLSGIILLGFSNSLSIYNAYTNIPSL